MIFMYPLKSPWKFSSVVVERSVILRIFLIGFTITQEGMIYGKDRVYLLLRGKKITATGQVRKIGKLGH
jgi:hypothetical protein